MEKKKREISGDKAKRQLRRWKKDDFRELCQYFRGTEYVEDMLTEGVRSVALNMEKIHRLAKQLGVPVPPDVKDAIAGVKGEMLKELQKMEAYRRKSDKKGPYTKRRRLYK